MQEKWDDLWDVVGKVCMYLLYGVIGFIGNLSMKVIRGTKLTWKSVLAEAGTAFFIGWLAAYYCMKYNPDAAGYYIPMATYLSSKIALIIMNWQDTKKYIIELLRKS